MNPRMQIASLLIALIALIATVATAASIGPPQVLPQTSANGPAAVFGFDADATLLVSWTVSPTPNWSSSASPVGRGARLPGPARHRGSHRRWRPSTGATTWPGQGSRTTS